MKLFLLTLVTCISIPTMAGAIVVTNTGSSATSGGMYAGSGEVVVTGPSSASSQVRTTVVGDSTGTDVRVEITTERDGEQYREVRQERVAPQEPVRVMVATTSALRARLETGVAATTTDTTRVQMIKDWQQALRSRLEGIFSRIARLFSWGK